MNKLKELYIYTSKKGIKDTVSRIKTKYCHITPFFLFLKNLDKPYSGITLDNCFKCVQGNLELLNEMREKINNLPREFYVDKTHGGKTFYLVYHKNEIAYIHWIFKKGEYSRFFDIQDENTFEINYIIALPKFRGNRLQAKAINYTCNDLKQKGYKRVISAVSKGNILSIKGMKRAGLKEFKKVKSFYSFVKKTKV